MTTPCCTFCRFAVCQVLGTTDPIVHAQTTQLRLTHIATEAALQTTGQVLPTWGFGQLEVITKRNAKEEAASMWWIDYHENAALNDTPHTRPVYMPFLEKLKETLAVSLRANEALQVSSGRVERRRSRHIEGGMTRQGGWRERRERNKKWAMKHVEWFAPPPSLLVLYFVFICHHVCA